MIFDMDFTGSSSDCLESQPAGSSNVERHDLDGTYPWASAIHLFLHSSSSSWYIVSLGQGDILIISAI